MNSIKIPWFIYPIFASFALAWLITGIVSYKFTPVLTEGVKISSKSTNTAKKADIALINEKNVFSLKTVAPVVGQDGEVITAEAPVAKNLKLIGVMLGHGRKSYAFLDLDGEKVLVGVGETVSGVKLESLDKTSGVVTTQNGKFTLQLYEQSATATPAPTAPTRTPTPTPSNDDSEPGDMSMTEKISVSRADFVSSMGDVNNIIKSALMRPYEQDGEIVGFKLSRMTQDSFLRTLGLRNGDAIMRINGEELKAPDVLFSMLGSIENVSAVTLDLERAGQRKTIFVEIN